MKGTKKGIHRRKIPLHRRVNQIRKKASKKKWVQKQSKVVQKDFFDRWFADCQQQFAINPSNTLPSVVHMLCRLTIGKKDQVKFEKIATLLKASLKESQHLNFSATSVFTTLIYFLEDMERSLSAAIKLLAYEISECKAPSANEIVSLVRLWAVLCSVFRNPRITKPLPPSLASSALSCLWETLNLASQYCPKKTSHLCLILLDILRLSAKNQSIVFLYNKLEGIDQSKPLFKDFCETASVYVRGILSHKSNSLGPIFTSFLRLARVISKIPQFSDCQKVIQTCEVPESAQFIVCHTFNSQKSNSDAKLQPNQVTMKFLVYQANDEIIAPLLQNKKISSEDTSNTLDNNDELGDGFFFIDKGCGDQSKEIDESNLLEK
eukprot:c63_g1_i1.p1 GENE.c63_g1_i1~~c63_g1_i1.p1  ORF type:complete len:386 (+),score=126.66 c63_g1_i1:27-1160(+)